MGQQYSQTQFGQMPVNILEHLQKRFIISPHPIYTQSKHFQLLHEKLTNKKYILRVISSNDEQQTARFQQLINKKLANKNQYLTPLQHYIFDQDNSYCSKTTKCYLLFNINSGITLREAILKQKLSHQQSQSPFKEEQLVQGMQDLTMAIMQLKYLNHPHQNVNPNNIYLQERRMKLSDPWISPDDSDTSEMYPSPEKLLKMNNKIQEYDPYASDIFAIGMCMLQAANQTVSDKVYKRNYQIDFAKLSAEIERCQFKELKAILQKILLGKIDDRKDYIDLISSKSKSKSKFSGIRRTIQSKNDFAGSNTSDNPSLLLKQMSREKSIKDTSKPVIDIGIIKPAPADHYKSIKLEKSPTVSTAAPKVYFGNGSQTNLQYNPTTYNPTYNPTTYNPTYNPPVNPQNKPFSYYQPNTPNQSTIPSYQLTSVPSSFQGQLPSQLFNKNQFTPSSTPVYQAKTYNSSLPPSDTTGNTTDYPSYQKYKFQQYYSKTNYLSSHSHFSTQGTPSISSKSPIISQTSEGSKFQPFNTFNITNNPPTSNSHMGSFNVGDSPSKRSQLNASSKRGDSYNVSEGQSSYDENSYHMSAYQSSSQKKNDSQKSVNIQQDLKKLKFLKHQSTESKDYQDFQQNRISQPKQNVQIPAIIDIASNLFSQSDILSSQELINTQNTHEQNVITSIDQAHKDTSSKQDKQHKYQTPNKATGTGTQLQVLNNLTIPQQQQSDQQSNGQGKPKLQKGQFLQQVYENGGKYLGFIYNGKRNGQGTFYYKDGGYYQGHWKDNMMNGFGRLYYDTGDLAYEGQWYRDEFHGRGKVYNDNSQELHSDFNYRTFQHVQNYWKFYQGDLSHDTKSGYGKIMLSNGEYFAGEFRNDKVHGKGQFFKLDGSIVKGIWSDGILIKQIP